MSTPDASTLLTYANVQMAAETIYPIGFSAGPIQASWLVNGNNRASKFTPTQATAFAAEWEVVNHKENTGTGFSGTLFKYVGQTDPARGLTRNQLVMSFRSTEFIDDAARDNQATNDLEIKSGGYAIGQIADMEQWFGTLDAPGGALHNQNFSVTGYSLGGHLATAFRQMHDHESQRITGVYTFNGAGIEAPKPNSGRSRRSIALQQRFRQM